MDLGTFLVITHVVGATLGTGGATLAEVQIIRALKDGAVDPSERSLMHGNYAMIRVGLAIAVVSGIALVAWQVAQGDTAVLSSAKVWFKSYLVLCLIANAVLLTYKAVPLWLGSAISFSGWWSATVLGLWRDVPFSFGELFVGYVGIVAVCAAVQSALRYLLIPRSS